MNAIEEGIVWSVSAHAQCPGEAATDSLENWTIVPYWERRGQF